MPREIPLSVRLYLRLRSTPLATTGWGLALSFFGFALTPAFMVHNKDAFGALLAVGIGCFVGSLALLLPIYAWFVGGKAIRLLREGAATQATFYGVNLAGTSVINTPVVVFEYQVEGKTYTVSSQAFGKSHLTIATNSVVFYDPMLPDKAVVLDDNIHFNESLGFFGCDMFCCLPPLSLASIVCGVIVAIVALVSRAI